MRTQESPPDLEGISRRYQRLYTGAVADVLDELGLRNQALPHEIRPLSDDMKVAGFAFTLQGRASGDAAAATREDYVKALSKIDELPPFCVVVCEPGRDTDCAHWGELSSNAVRARGCQGVVVDGGVRDSGFIRRIRFPVFARYRTMVDAVGRWVPSCFQQPIQIGAVVVHPGDFVFGDMDGVLVVPRDLTNEVLERAEKVRRVEGQVRRELRAGTSAMETFEKYGKF